MVVPRHARSQQEFPEAVIVKFKQSRARVYRQLVVVLGVLSGTLVGFLAASAMQGGPGGLGPEVLGSDLETPGLDPSDVPLAPAPGPRVDAPRAAGTITSGLVGLWSMEDSAVDYLGHATSRTAGGYTTSGRHRSAGVFVKDDNADVITVNDHADIDIDTGHSWGCWLNLTDLPTEDCSGVLCKDLEYTLRVEVEEGYALSTWVYDSVDGSWQGVTGGHATTGTWTHLMGVLDGNALVLYVNGDEVARRTDIDGVTASANSLTIGSMSGYQPCGAHLDDVRIYNRALAAWEVRAVMDYGLSYSQQVQYGNFASCSPWSHGVITDDGGDDYSSCQSGSSRSLFLLKGNVNGWDANEAAWAQQDISPGAGTSFAVSSDTTVKVVVGDADLFADLQDDDWPSDDDGDVEADIFAVAGTGSQVGSSSYWHSLEYKDWGSINQEETKSDLNNYYTLSDTAEVGNYTLDDLHVRVGIESHTHRGVYGVYGTMLDERWSRFYAYVTNVEAWVLWRDTQDPAVVVSTDSGLANGTCATNYDPSQTPTSHQVKWRLVDEVLDAGSTSYSITGDATDSGTWINGEEISVNVGDLRAGTYSYTCTAEDGYGGAQSLQQVLTVNAIDPDPVTGFTATPETGQVRLDWTRIASPADDGGADITGYHIDRKVNGGGFISDYHVTDDLADTWTDTDVTNESAYQYRIRARNAGLKYSSSYVNSEVVSPAGPAPTITINTSNETIYTAAPTMDVDFSDPDGLDSAYYKVDSYIPTGTSTTGWTAIFTGHAGTSFTTNFTLDAGVWAGLGEGTHVVYFKAWDDLANVNDWAFPSWGFRKDISGPQIADNQAGDDAWRRAAGTTYHVTFSDQPAGLDYAEYCLGSTPGGASDLKGWTTIFGPGYAGTSYSTHWPVDFAACQEGTTYVSVRAYDDLGNVTSADDVFHIRKDTTSPDVASMTCTDGSGVVNDTWTPDADPAFTWGSAVDPNGAAGSGVAGYYYYFGTNPTGMALAYTTGTSHDPAPLASSGTYYLRVQCTDGAGNNASWQTLFAYRYDGDAPAYPTDCTSTGGVTNATWTTVNDPTLSWTGQADPLSGLAGYHVYWGLDPAGTSAAWTPTPSYTPDPLPAGEAATYYLRVKCGDAVGNNNSWLTLFEYRYDASAPTYRVNTANGSYFNAAPTVNVTFTDLGALDDAYYQVDTNFPGGTNTTGWTAIFLDQGANATTLFALDAVWAGLADGPHVLYVKAWDAAGNVNDTAARGWAFVKDAENPAYSIHATNYTAYDHAPTMAGDGDVDIWFDDAYNLSSAYFKVDSWLPQGADTTGWVPIWEDVAVKSDHSGFDFPAGVWAGLAEGLHTMYFKVIDDAGNVGENASLNWIFEKESGWPAVSVHLVNGTAHRVAPTLDVDFSDPDGLDSAYYKVNSYTPTGTSTIGWTPIFTGHAGTAFTTNFTLDAGVWAGLGEGTHVVYFKAWDDLNVVNDGPLPAWAFVKDTTAPVATLVDVLESSPHVYWSGTTLYFSNDQAMAASVTFQVTDNESGAGRANATGESAFGAEMPVDGTYGTAWEVTYTISQGETCDGTITITVHDAAGNYDTVDVPVVLDNVNPSIDSAEAVEASAYVHISGSTIYYGDDMAGAESFTLQGTASDGGAGLASATFTTCDLGGPGEDLTAASWAGTYADVGNIDDWTGALTVTLTDRVGNVATVQFTVIRDTTNPSLESGEVVEASAYIFASGTTIYYGDDMAGAESFTLQGTASDVGAGLASATFAACDLGAPGEDLTAASWAGIYADVGAGDAFAGSLSVTLTDRVGNEVTVGFFTVVREPTGASGFLLETPGGWVQDQTPDVVLSFSMPAPGLIASAVQFAYSTTGNPTPVNWAAVDGVYLDAGCTTPAADGATGTLYARVFGVAFNQDSGTSNTIRLRALDRVSNPGLQGSAVAVQVDTTAPETFALEAPTGVVEDQTPDVTISFATTGSGVAVASVEFAYSTTGDPTPANWAAVTGVFTDAGCTTPAGDGATGTLYARVDGVPFHQNSLADNTLRVRGADVAGNLGTQAAAVVIQVETVLDVSVNSANGTHYNAAPVMDVDFLAPNGLDSAYYQVDSYAPAGTSTTGWTAIFTGHAGTVHATDFTLDAGIWAALGEGTHVVYFKAWDDVANVRDGPAHAWQFYKDTAAPTPPTDCTSTGGVSNDTWTAEADPTLEWSGMDDGAGSGIAGYTYYWGTSAAGTSTDYTTSTSLAPGPLSGTAVYYLRVKVGDHAGNNNSWLTVFVYRYDGEAPTNPDACNEDTYGTGNNTWTLGTHPTFSWAGAGDTGGSGVAGYHVYWGPDPAGTAGTFRTPSTYDPGVLATAGTYHLRARVVDLAGNNASAWVTLFTYRYDGEAPSVGPVTGAIDPVSENADQGLECIVADGSGAGVAWRYLYYKVTTGGAWHALPLVGDAATIPAAAYAGGDVVYYYAGAGDLAGNLQYRHGGGTTADNATARAGAYAFTVSADLVLPAAPELAAITPDPDLDGTVALDWTDVPAANTYAVYRHPTPVTTLNGSVTLVASSLTASEGVDVVASGTWWYAVTVTNGSGTSPVSNTVPVTVAIPPGAPALAAITPDPDLDGTILLDWTVVPGADTYAVYRHPTPVTTLNGSVTLVASSLTASEGVDFVASGTWWYVVTATNATGTSAPSNGVAVTVAIPPAAPLLAPVVPNPDVDGNVTITWSLVPGATAYRVYRAATPVTTVAGLTPLGEVATVAYLDAGLANGTHYYAVVAVNATGTSGPSNSAGVTVAIPPVYVPPLAPVLAPVVPNPTTNGSIALAWAAVPGATSYRVYRGASIITTLNDSTTLVAGDLTSPAHVDAGRPAGTWYYVVVAVNASGPSAPSNCEGVTVTPPPLVYDPVAFDESYPLAAGANTVFVNDTRTGALRLVVVLTVMDDTTLHVKGYNPAASGFAGLGDVGYLYELGVTDEESVRYGYVHVHVVYALADFAPGAVAHQLRALCAAPDSTGMPRARSQWQYIPLLSCNPDLPGVEVKLNIQTPYLMLAHETQDRLVSYEYTYVLHAGANIIRVNDTTGHRRMDLHVNIEASGGAPTSVTVAEYTMAGLCGFYVSGLGDAGYGFRVQFQDAERVIGGQYVVRVYYDPADFGAEANGVNLRVAQARGQYTGAPPDALDEWQLANTQLDEEANVLQAPVQVAHRFVCVVQLADELVVTLDVPGPGLVLLAPCLLAVAAVAWTTRRRRIHT